MALSQFKLGNEFAAGAGLIRCTDGKLVTSQDQCPTTDVCPPPQNDSVSHCVERSSSNSSSQNSDNQSVTNNSIANAKTCNNNRITFHTPKCTD